MRSQADLPNIDLRFVIDTETQFRSVLDMARLAIEAVEIRVAGELTRFSERFGRVIPNGDRVLGLALCIDDVEQQTIRGDGICREQHLLGIEAELPVRR